MKLTHLSWLLNRFVRFVISASICTLMFAYSSVPALANTNVTKGEEQMPKILIKSQKVVESDPYSLEKTQYESNKGINEVQGNADKDKMFNPSNTDGPASVEQQIGNALESTKDKADDAVGSVKDKVSDTAKNLKDKADDTASSVKDKAVSTAKNLTDKAGDAFDSAKGKGETLKAKADRKVDSVKAKAEQESDSFTDKVKNLFNG